MTRLPGTSTLVEGGIEAETRQALRDIATVFEAHGPGRDRLPRCTVMLAGIAEWPAFNAVSREFFADLPMPARSAFSCSGLALGARVETECTAVR